MNIILQTFCANHEIMLEILIKMHCLNEIDEMLMKLPSIFKLQYLKTNTHLSPLFGLIIQRTFYNIT